MSIGAFIIVRTGSTRLPKKCMMRIFDKPMIELVVERVRASNLVDKIVITTSTHPLDDPLEELAGKLKVGCFRGSLDDVMERISKAAEKYDCETITELLGDNPLVHSDLIDDVIKFYFSGKYDYAATVTKEYPVSRTEKKLFSVGVRVQVYSRHAASKWTDYPDYIENENKSYGAYMFEHPQNFKIGYFEAIGKWSFMNKPDLTFAVNYEKDFEFIKTIFEQNYHKDKNFSLKEVYKQVEKEKSYAR